MTPAVDQCCELRQVETGTRHTSTLLNESSVHLLTAQLRDQDSSERYSRPKPTWVMVLLTASLCHSPFVLFQTCFLSSLQLCFITCPTLMCCTCVSLSSHSSPSFCASSSVISSASSIWIPLSLWLISRVLTYFCLNTLIHPCLLPEFTVFLILTLTACLYQLMFFPSTLQLWRCNNSPCFHCRGTLLDTVSHCGHHFISTLSGCHNLCLLVQSQSSKFSRH